jgi:hypothetical protein
VGVASSFEVSPVRSKAASDGTPVSARPPLPAELPALPPAGLPALPPAGPPALPAELPAASLSAVLAELDDASHAIASNTTPNHRTPTPTIVREVYHAYVTVAQIRGVLAASCRPRPPDHST